MKLKFAALLLLISVGAFSQNKIVLTAPRLDTSSLSNRINLKANTNLNNVNGVLSSTYGGAGSVSGLLKANGSGGVSAATASDIPSLSAYYLPLSGGTLTGALSGTSLSMSGEGLFGGAITDGTNKLKVTGPALFSSSVTASGFSTTSTSGISINSGDGVIDWSSGLRFIVYISGSGYVTPLTLNNTTGAATFSSSVTASLFVKSGGTSTQFLKADGSVDGNTYLTSASITGKLNISDTATMLSNYARLSGANFTGSIGSTRGVFNNSTQSQLEIFGWNNIQGASTNAGEIRFGGTSSVQGRLIYSSAGNSTLYLDNTFDNANAEIKLRTRVAGTAVDALTLTSTAATFPSTMKSAGLIQPISLKTSTYTLTTNDHTVIFNTASGNLTARLPAGVEGQIFVLRKSAYGISTNDLNITPNGSETIEGAASYTISACSGVAVTLQFLSGNWYIINMAFIGNPC